MTYPSSSGKNIPFDGKSSDSRLLSEDVSSDLLEDGFGWRISIELFGIVLIVDIVSNSYELSAVVGAGKEDDGDAEDLSIWNALGVRWVGFEDKLVDADWDGADEEGIKLLVMLIAEKMLALQSWKDLRGDKRSSRADISQLPFEIYTTESVYVGTCMCRKRSIPFCSDSRHSNVISNSYGSPNLAGLLRTLTPKRDTTDILKVVYEAVIQIFDECNEEEA